MESAKPERRLAAILAADVVGYSRMMGVDEAGTHTRLKEFEKYVLEPAVAVHSGRIVKRMGDGYLVEFQSVVSAIECAIDWQNGADGQVTFRIGINLGDVIVEDNDLFGEGVNVAARLEAIADPGGVCISEDAWRQSKGRVEARFEDLGEKHLKNIASPIGVYRLVFDDGQLPEEPQKGSDGGGTQSAWKGPKILLSPFRHLGSSRDAEGLASGLTETLAAALAHFEEFELIDPGSAMQSIANLGTLGAGRRIGAEYILEGSVQTAGQKVRIGVQLIEVASGQRVWSDTLDRSLDDAFELQDEITAFVASTMSDAVGEEQAKAISGKPDSALDLHEQMVRGIQLLHRINPDDNGRARGIFENVLRADRHGMFPTLCLCWTYVAELSGGWPRTRRDALPFALSKMRELMHRHPRSAHVHRLMSRLCIFDGDHAQGVAHAERAYELNPYHSDMMIALGLARLWNGESDQAVVHLERAFSTNRYAPDVFKIYLALAYFLVERFSDALKLLDGSEGMASVMRIYRVLTLVGSGQIEPAEREARLLLAENTDFSLANAQSINSFRRKEDRERIFAALRKTGLR